MNGQLKHFNVSSQQPVDHSPLITPTSQGRRPAVDATRHRRNVLPREGISSEATRRIRNPGHELIACQGPGSTSAEVRGSKETTRAESRPICPPAHHNYPRKLLTKRCRNLRKFPRTTSVPILFDACREMKCPPARSSCVGADLRVLVSFDHSPLTHQDCLPSRRPIRSVRAS